jgi:hypothetical protein
MEYKVTALQDVTLRAYVRSKKPKDIGGHVVLAPTESQQWVSLRAGEVRDGLGLVVGVHPKCCPDERAVSLQGVSIVTGQGWSNSELPKEFYGLFRLECHADGQD